MFGINSSFNNNSFPFGSNGLGSNHRHGSSFHTNPFFRNQTYADSMHFGKSSDYKLPGFNAFDGSIL